MKSFPVSALALCAATFSTASFGLAPAASAQGCEAGGTAKAVSRMGGLLGRSRLGSLLGSMSAGKVGQAEAIAEQVQGAAKQMGVGTATGGCGNRAAQGSQSTSTSRKSAAAASFGYPKDLPVPAEIKAQKEAFDAFGRYECTECEGGHAYDSWAQQSFAGKLRGYNAWAEKLGSMPVGASLPWSGMKARGVLTVVSANPVGGFACKQLRYTLTKGKAQAERQGLLCQGKLNAFDAGPSWVEVY